MRNGTLNATFDTFSLNTVTNGDSSAGDGSEIYIVADGVAASAQLIDDILGQSGTSSTADIDSSAINSGTAPSFSGTKAICSPITVSVACRAVHLSAVTPNSIYWRATVDQPIRWLC